MFVSIRQSGDVGGGGGEGRDEHFEEWIYIHTLSSLAGAVLPGPESTFKVEPLR
jgi:hypothetical protein